MVPELMTKRCLLSAPLVKFVYFLVLLICGLMTWLVINNKVEKDFIPMSPITILSVVKFNQSFNMDADQVVQGKIDEMKRELNDSALNDEAMFPANRISRYIWADPNVCKGSLRINVIIIVHTAPSHFKQRQRIRNSYGNQHLFQPFQIRVAFLLGDTLNNKLKKDLWMEHVQHNDTVMGDFIDDYHNLSLKGVMGYHWVSQYCPNSDIVLKTDDDVLVNMFKLLYSFLPHMLGKKKSIFCNLWYKGTMPILREGKWKVESHVFSSRDLYPYDYCSGFVVLMTTDLMGSLYEAAKITPFFWIDDVYLYGMLPLVVGGVTYYNYALNESISLKQHTSLRCTFAKRQKCPVFATLISDSLYSSFWDIITETYALPNWQFPRRIVN